MPPSPSEGRSIRLLSVGCGVSADPSLETLAYAAGDAEEFRRAFSESVVKREPTELECRTLADPTLAEFVSTLEWLYDSGAAVLYFSGHAVSLAGNDVGLVTRDSRRDRPVSLLTRDVLHRLLLSGTANSTLWVMDACFAELIGQMPSPGAHYASKSLTVIGATRANTFGPVDPISGAGISPFTQSFVAALCGMAGDGFRQFTADEIFDFVVFDATREGRPEPCMTSLGRKCPLRFQTVRELDDDDSERWQPPSIMVWSQPEVVRSTLVLGPEGSGRNAVASRLVHRDSKGGHADARTPLLMSLRPGWDSGSETMAFHNADSEESLDVIRGLGSSRPLVVTTAPSSPVESLAERFDITVVPSPTADLVRDRLQRARGPQIADEMVERIFASAGGSLLEVHRLTSYVATLPEESLREGALPLPDLARHVRSASAENAQVGAILTILGWLPGIKFRLVDLTASPVTISRLLDSGLVISNGTWVQLPNVYSRAARETSGERRAAMAVDLIGKLMERAAGDRVIALRALATLLRIGRGTVGAFPAVDRAISTYGEDLVLAGSAIAVVNELEPFVRAIGSPTAGVLKVLSNAYRLADDFPASVRVLRSLDQRQGVDAQTAAISAVKNQISGDGREARRIMGEVIATAGPKLTGQLHFQLGNLCVLSSMWDEARDHYNAAIAGARRVGGLAQSRLEIDALKGLGDIALYGDSTHEPRYLASQIRDVLAEHRLAPLARATHAKAFQFFGDCCRRALIDPLPSLPQRDAVFDAAEYFYGRSLDGFRRERMVLGELMTLQRRWQLRFLRGASRNAMAGVWDVAVRFEQLGHSQGLIRSNVILAFCLAELDDPPSSLRTTVNEYLAAALRGRSLAPHQALFVKVALATSRAGWDAEHRASAVDEAGALGLPRFQRLAATGRPADWLGYY